MLHHFTRSISHIALPDKFTYPFHYTPHPLCVMAADEVQVYLQHQAQWQDELQQGKMFGVLIVQTTEGEIGYLAAFSGILAGKISILILFLPSTIYSNRTDSSRKKKNISPPSTTAYVSWKRIPLIRTADKHWKKKQHDAADSFHKPKPN